MRALYTAKIKSCPQITASTLTLPQNCLSASQSFSHQPWTLILEWWVLRRNPAGGSRGGGNWLSLSSSWAAHWPQAQFALGRNKACVQAWSGWSSNLHFPGSPIHSEDALCSLRMTNVSLEICVSGCILAYLPTWLGLVSVTKWGRPPTDHYLFFPESFQQPGKQPDRHPRVRSIWRSFTVTANASPEQKQDHPASCESIQVT